MKIAGYVIAGCVLLVAANGVATVNLSRKIDAMEGKLIAGERVRGVDASMSDSNPHEFAATPATDFYTAIRRTTPAERRAASNQVQLRYQGQRQDPLVTARQQDALLQHTPRNMAVEERNGAWLQSALQDFVNDARMPPARYAQTSCQGNRCMVSAEFRNTAEARDWSRRFLLASGGRHLTRSVPVITGNPSGSGAKLQLYLY